MAPDMTNDNLTAIITWALDRILQGEFKEALDSAGNIDSLVIDKDFGPVSSKPRAVFEGNAVAPHNAGLPLAPPLYLERKYVKELRNLLPAMIRRADSLRLPPTAKELPEYVNRYLSEAARCYIYGHHLAALFLCRSALGEAVVVALRNKGPAKGMGAITEDGLRGILKIARDEGLMDKALHAQADHIRILANQAIQNAKLPSDDECKKAFEMTKSIVQHLYA